MAPIFTPGDSLGSMEMTGEHHYPVTVTVSDEPTSADGRSWSYIIEWAEGLTWHRDHLYESFPNPDDDTLEAMNVLVGDELSKAGAPGTLIDEVQVDVGPNYQHNPDEEALIVSTTVFLPEGAHLGDLQDAAWPFIATMINVTDPGTFGSRYIMSALTKED